MRNMKISKPVVNGVVYIAMQELEIDLGFEFTQRLLFDRHSIKWRHLAQVFSTAALRCLEEAEREGE